MSALASASEKKLQEVLELAPDAMVLANREGKIVMVNSKTEQIFGYARAELLGQRLEMLIPERFRGTHIGHRADYSAAPRLRPMGSGLNLYGLRKNGEEFPVDIRLNHMGTGEEMLAISSIRDISERVRAEEQFHVRLKALGDFKAPLD